MGRGLERLFDADRASLLSELILGVITEFGIPPPSCTRTPPRSPCPGSTGTPPGQSEKRSTSVTLRSRRCFRTRGRSSLVPEGSPPSVRSWRRRSMRASWAAMMVLGEYGGVAAGGVEAEVAEQGRGDVQREPGADEFGDEQASEVVWGEPHGLAVGR